ncbi:hypothetical protein B5P43_31795 [Bacillus sp. SRB_336]|nr:hypothetical protein B5P43_31795 [Bacillus sp. SRB_336]
MAKSGLDDALPPVAFVSREELAASLGFLMPDLGDTSDNPKRRATVLNLIKRAIRELHEAGAISTRQRGQAGRRAVYELHLDRPTWPTIYEARYRQGIQKVSPAADIKSIDPGIQKVSPDRHKECPPMTTKDNQETKERTKSKQAVSSSTRASRFDDGERLTFEQEQARQSAALRAMPSDNDYAEEAA